MYGKAVTRVGTKIRAEVAKSNEYYISKERNLELRHYCLQYKEWKMQYLYSAKPSSPSLAEKRNTSITYPVEEAAILRELYKSRMDLVERTAKRTDPALANYIFKAVTEGRSYTYLRMHDGIPCSELYYRKRYRKFFWLLDREISSRELHGL